MGSLTVDNLYRGDLDEGRVRIAKYSVLLMMPNQAGERMVVPGGGRILNAEIRSKFLKLG